jgi:hypothetical protein
VRLLQIKLEMKAGSVIHEEVSTGLRAIKEQGKKLNISALPNNTK